MSCRCKLCPDCMGKTMQAMAELGAIEERLKSKNKQINQLRAEVERYRAWAVDGAVDGLIQRAEQAEAENATLKLRFANYDILRQTMLDVAHENVKLRTVEEAAKLLKTDPNNDAYRFNLWQALKDKEGV